MAQVLANSILYPLIVSHLIHARDIASLSQVSSEIRATSLALVRHSESTRLGFKDTKVKSKYLLETLKIRLWRLLQVLDLRGCSRVTGSILKPLLYESRLTTLLMSDCVKLEYNTLMKILRGMLKAIKLDHKARAGFAPLAVLDAWGIAGLQLHCQYQGKAEWLNSYHCPYLRNLSNLLDIAEELQFDPCIGWCICHFVPGTQRMSTEFASRSSTSIQLCNRAQFLPFLLGMPHYYGRFHPPCPACALRLHACDMGELLSSVEVDAVLLQQGMSAESLDMACGGCYADRSLEEFPLKPVSYQAHGT